MSSHVKHSLSLLASLLASLLGLSDGSLCRASLLTFFGITGFFLIWLIDALLLQSLFLLSTEAFFSVASILQSDVSFSYVAKCSSDLLAHNEFLP